MTGTWKKTLVLNLPYLLFVYLFDKFCQAVRLAPGLDASEKFLHLSQGFTGAFSSGLPSLHPLDLLVGIAGAVIVRLAVYAKGKNARKYRRGIEYGSARWGTAADIAPYVDPVPDRNIPLPRRKSSPCPVARKIPSTPGTKTFWSSAAAAAARPVSLSSPLSCRCTVPMWSPIPKGSFCPRLEPCCAGAPPQAGRERKAHAGCPRKGHL